jgi:hypothetical protein
MSELYEAVKLAVEVMECNSYGLDGHIPKYCVRCQLEVALNRAELSRQSDIEIARLEAP